MREARMLSAVVNMYRESRRYGDIKPQAMPDDVIEFAGFHWECLGYAPFIMFRVNERGIPWRVVDRAMTAIVGENWAKLNCTDWCDIIESKGVANFFDRPDDPPLCDMLVNIILCYEMGWWRE